MSNRHLEAPVRSTDRPNPPSAQAPRRTKGQAGPGRLALATATVLGLLLALVQAEEPRDVTGKIDDYNQWKQSLGVGKATDPATITAPPGFRVELLRSAGADEGSWIGLTIDPKGRLIVSREDKGLLRMTLAQDQPVVERVETVNDTLLECRGLLWAYDAIYASANNSKGLYRLRDTDGDDQFDEVQLLKATPGNVGHGRNDLALGPDGMIYAIHGDDVRLPDDFDPSRSPLRNYFEARLLPCRWDSQMFNAPMRLPAGHVARTDRDGQGWEVIAGGMRNPYGIDFSPEGELFTFDADMELDAGLPWYRPTRVLHLVSGADYGWRLGTGVWPAWYPDSLPAVLDVGLSSPTAVRFATTSRFPERYRRALLMCDWSYGRILAVHLEPKGASFTASAEPFLSGRPLNVTDLEFGPDGALYFLTGGRRTQSGLYRVSYTGPMPADERPLAQQPSPAVQTRRQLEALHLSGQSAELDLIWPHLGSDDPFLRHAARVALEQRPMPLWRERALAENNPWAVISALMALARLGSADTQTPLLERLAALGWEELTAEQRAAVLRIWSLALARHERLPAERLAPIAQLLDRRYPDEAPPVNQLLCELLVYLGSPNAIGKTLALLEMAKTQEEKLEYLFLLREAAGPSTPEQNRSYFDALRQARHFYGGSELPRMLGLIKADAVARLTEAEQTALAPLLADEPPSEVPVELVNRPFVRDWKFDDLVGSIEQIGNGRDLAAGKAIFAAALCSKCHRMAGQGTAIGPDLTSLARRFGPVDILLSILAPSRVVDEKYRLVTIETTDGRVLKGQLLGDDGQFVTLLPDVLAADKTLRLAKSEIESLTHSIVSPMPDGLLNRFTKDEVLDLLAYLESEGVESAAKPVLPK